jgi:hypothetical protein
MAKKMYESPQASKDGLATTSYGGDAPDAEDVKKSANARAQKRHAVKSPSDSEADSLVPKSVGKVLDKAGINNNGYIVKKGLEYGIDAFYNTLPPGMDIEDQENADIRTMETYTYSGGLSYPKDGW